MQVLESNDVLRDVLEAVPVDLQHLEAVHEEEAGRQTAKVGVRKHQRPQSQSGEDVVLLQLRTTVDDVDGGERRQVNASENVVQRCDVALVLEQDDVRQAKVLGPDGGLQEFLEYGRNVFANDKEKRLVFRNSLGFVSW